MDAELSPLVCRSFCLATAESGYQSDQQDRCDVDGATLSIANEALTVLRTEYKATTNRMLRVAVNGYMESLGVVVDVMEELDVDVLDEVRT